MTASSVTHPLQSTARPMSRSNSIRHPCVWAPRCWTCMHPVCPHTGPCSVVPSVLPPNLSAPRIVAPTKPPSFVNGCPYSGTTHSGCNCWAARLSSNQPGRGPACTTCCPHSIVHTTNNQQIRRLAVHHMSTCTQLAQPLCCRTRVVAAMIINHNNVILVAQWLPSLVAS